MERKILIIIPTYNEIENIERMVTTVLGLSMGYHLLVIDDGSPDKTGEKVKELKKTQPERLYLIEREGKQGLGTAYLTGFQWALEHHYDYIVEMDADFSHNPNDLEKLIAPCLAGKADMTVGSRYCKGVNVVNWPMGRVLLSYLASKYVRFVTRLPIADTTAGFVCYTAETLRTLHLNKIKMKGYGFQIEMKYRTWHRGFRIEEVPIVFTDRTKGKSKMSGGIFHEAMWGVIKLRLRYLLKKRQKCTHANP